MNAPLVSVVVVNWNGKEYLEKCLPSLEKQTWPNFEVILVDNGSTDDSLNFVEENYSDFVKVVRNSENLGFPEGCNTGIQTARGKYIAVLNNDTEVDSRWLEELVKVAEKDEKVGMCATKIYSYYDRKIIDNVGHLVYPDGLNRGRGRLEVDKGQYDIEEEVFSPSGCAALYRRRMLDEIGLFDETYFAYGDDIDLGIRGRLAGWKCVYVPSAVVYHMYSMAYGKYSPLKAFYVERNRIWVLLKLFPLPVVMISPVYTLIRYFWQAYGAFTHQGASGIFAGKFSKVQLFFILVKAYGSALRGLPLIFKKRRLIQAQTKVSTVEFINWLRKFRISAKEISLKE